MSRASTYLVSFTFLFLLSATPFSANANRDSADTDLGPLVMNHTKVPWPVPETLLQNLHAEDSETLDKALSLLGVPHASESARFDPPEETELRYADLGVDASQQAIIGVRTGAVLYGAVAAQVGGRWQRIAAFSCWCKYESEDLLGGFIHIQSGPGTGEELVLRASGGGTGVYSQQQAHFRYVRGELRLVFTFVRHVRNCNPTKPGPYSCEVERRWFNVNYWGSTPGAVLVESHMTLFPDADPEGEFTVPELQLAHAQKFSCKTYKWDEQKFRYEPFVAANPCAPQESGR